MPSPVIALAVINGKFDDEKPCPRDKAKIEPKFKSVAKWCAVRRKPQTTLSLIESSNEYRTMKK